MRAVGADSVEAEPGDRFGRFEILAKLASGGMGRVYLARAKGPAGFEKTVALKTIHPDLASRPDFVQMFLDEARIAAKLEHPNVCRVFDFGQAEGTYFLAMEYLVGEPLSRVLAAIAAADEHEPRPAHTDAVLAKIVADAAEGLHAAHELLGDDGEPLELVHRDVSPHNVFVTYDGGVRIVDFGVASAGRRTSESGNELKGKLPYMAPEQVARVALDRRVDVWGLGVVLWEGYAGTTLWPARTELEVLQSIAHDPVPPLGRLRPDLPRQLVDITMRALEKDPARRWPTARDLGQALQRWLASRGEPIGLPEVAALLTETFPGGRAQKLALLDRMKLASADAADRISSASRPKSSVRASTPPAGARPEGATRASIPSALERAPSVPPSRGEETVVAGRPASGAETFVGDRPVGHGTFVGPLDPEIAAQIARPVFGAGVTAQRLAVTVPAAPVTPRAPSPPPPAPEPLASEPTSPSAPFAPPPIAVVSDADIVRARPAAKWRARIPMLVGLVVVAGLGGGAWWATHRAGPTEMVATPLTARVTAVGTGTGTITPTATATATITPTATPTATPAATPAATATPTVAPSWGSVDPEPPAERRAPERRTEGRSAVDETGPGTVAVTTEGGWADLYVDGESVGSTRSGPARFELPSGRHSLELRPFGFRAPGPGMTRSVVVEPGRTARVRVTLEE